MQANDIDKFIEDFIKHLQNIDIKKIIPGIFAVIALLIAYSSFYTVQPDEEAVILRFGKYSKTSPPGLHFKLPLGIDQAIKVRTKQVLQEEFGFRTSTTHGERTTYSKSNFEIESLMLTGDLNVAQVEWVLQYQISDPYKFLYKTSSPIKNIRDVSQAVMRRVVGDMLFTDIITAGRTKIVSEAKRITQEILDLYDMGVFVVSIQLQDVTPPEQVKDSFNEFNAATQEREEMINKAETEYNRIIPEARGKAEREVAIAEGYAEALLNRSEGDSRRFRSMLAEYQRSPEVTRKRLYLERMEKLISRFDHVKIIDPNVKGVLPVFGGQTQTVKKEGK